VCKLAQQKADFITTFALAFGKQVAMTDARASLSDSYLRSILEATCFSDGYEEHHARVYCFPAAGVCCSPAEMLLNKVVYVVDFIYSLERPRDIDLGASCQNCRQ